MAFLSSIPSVVIFGCVSGEQRVPLNYGLRNNITVLGAGSKCQYFPCYDGLNKPVCCNQELYVCLSEVSSSEVIYHSLKTIESNVCVE